MKDCDNQFIDGDSAVAVVVGAHTVVDRTVAEGDGDVNDQFADRHTSVAVAVGDAALKKRRAASDCPGIEAVLRVGAYLVATYASETVAHPRAALPVDFALFAEVEGRAAYSRTIAGTFWASFRAAS